jgi:transcriptional regulator with XRE-family HTH domain
MTRKKATSVVDQLRRAIAESGESQNAIAEAIGIDQGNLNRFVNGERGVSMETFAELCEYLRLDLVRRR